MTAPADRDAEYADLRTPHAYAYWAGKLAMAVEFALSGYPSDDRVARATLAAYRTAVNTIDAA